MESTSKSKKAIEELVSNLGTNAGFMIGEVRAFLRKATVISGAVSQEAVPLKAQFDNAVDQAAKVMAQTGKLSKEDIQRAADKIKDSYELFQQEKDQEWDAFLKEMGNQIQKAKNVDQEVFKQSVEQAKKKMQEHLASVQGFGEDQKQVIAAYTDDMSSKATGMWQRLKSNLEEGGDKIHRAIEAAAAELKK
jgi:hypothetical protein